MSKSYELEQWSPSNGSLQKKTEKHSVILHVNSTMQNGDLGQTDFESKKKEEAGIYDLPTDKEEADPWKTVEFHDNGPKWSELSAGGKVMRVFVVLVKVIIVLMMLYFFICSLDIMGASFQLLGGRTAGQAFKNNELLRNPVCGLMIGVIVTVLLQSSSTSTSIVVTLVGANILTVELAIPIVMGANIGTTVTNTIVSLTMSAERDDFRRAFGAATVHDMFNWMTVIIILPLEVASKYLFRLTRVIVDTIPQGQTENPKLLKALTEPLTKLIVDIDKNVIKAIAQDNTEAKWPLLKYWKKTVTTPHSATFVGGLNQTYYDTIDGEPWTHKFSIKSIKNTTTGINYTTFSWSDVSLNKSSQASYLFHGQGVPGSTLSETACGGILLAGSLVVMVFCLLMMVKTLSSLMRGPLANVIRKTLNAELPGKLSFLTGYIAMVVGAGMTLIVQSSSVFTSALTPLVGMGMFTLDRMYPLTLGSNIGTTATGILAALTASSNFKETVQISLAHLFFNISGIILFYPIPPLRKIPIRLAQGLGDTTAKYRWFAIFYLILMFIALPGIVFALSIPGWYVLLGVGAPILLILIIIVIINVSQNKCPRCLPKVLQNWDFLPRPLRSLQPYDNVLRHIKIRCRNRCPCCKSKVEQMNDAQMEVKFTLTKGNGSNGGHVNEAFEKA